MPILNTEPKGQSDLVFISIICVLTYLLHGAEPQLFS